MTPQQKAGQIMNLLTGELLNAGHRINKPLIQKCALITADEVLKVLDKCNFQGAYMKGYEKSYMDIDEGEQYWQQVKEEIRKL